MLGGFLLAGLELDDGSEGTVIDPFCLVLVVAATHGLLLDGGTKTQLLLGEGEVQLR